MAFRDEIMDRLEGHKGKGSQGNSPWDVDIPMRIPKIAAAAIAGLTIAWGSWFYVPNGHQATVTRFGRYTHSEGPGLHGKLPLFDSVRKFNVEEITRMEIGYRSVDKEGKQYEGVPVEAQMLTGDENIADVDLALQIKIVDPVAHQYSLADPEGTLRDAAQATTRLVVGNNGIDKGLTDGRQEIQQLIQQNLQAIVNNYNMGREVTVQLQDFDPPEQVAESFRAVQTAKEQRETKVQQAKSYENKHIPAAEGAAAKLIEEAGGYSAKVVGEAQGDADRFLAILKEYRKAPDITRNRIYLEAMQVAYPTLDSTIIDSNTAVPLYHLNGKKE